MSSDNAGTRHVTADLVDPYALDPRDVQDPPTTIRGRLRFLGPGMITSAAVVGSGELLTATTLGAEAGFVLLWLVLVSTFLKVWVQIELGRWSISTGKVAVTGYNEVPPKIAGRGWMAWLVLLMFIQFLTSQAGVISAAAFAFSSLMPIGGDPYSLVSIGTWVAILVVIAIGIHVWNRYTIVEGVSTVLVVLVTTFAVVIVFLIQGSAYDWSLADLGEGMRFQIALGSMGVALSMFGLTGVGAGEVTAYTYWCVEKGYAAWSGRNDGSEAWARRARGWIKVMKMDAWVAWVVYTISTAAFYVLGAAVLHPQGIVPEGDEVMTTISSIFSTAVGQWGATVFLIGAGVALFKTIIANVPSLGRQVGNTLAVFGAFDWSDQIQRDRWMRGIMVVLPIIWGLLGTVVSSPLALVILAGILNAVFLMGVAASTVYLSQRQTDPLVKDGAAFTVMLVISALAIFLVGIVGLTNLF
ncbi:manganese transporter NRAMP [Occultella glacieicola]|uniref:Manganese transporter NRAMP n=1 Tax=Occultella glacieicola TaxID=2518684 RepID=A0ABY2E7R7_9MICO|nr:Nramp family divalent metal transporter [Occultella glacieicola]TDE97607.1 manganese transporter NRAMP [Occultella glacieicola]